MKLVCSILFFFSLFNLFSQSNIYDACRNGALQNVKNIYQNHPDKLNIKDKNGNTPLILACYYGHTEVVSFLIENVEDINVKTDQGTALMAATVKGNTEIVSLLLNKKININASDVNGTTALHYAVLFKNKSIIKQLVKAGALHNIKDNYGKSALDYAIINNNQEIIDLIRSNAK